MPSTQVRPEHHKVNKFSESFWSWVSISSMLFLPSSPTRLKLLSKIGLWQLNHEFAIFYWKKDIWSTWYDHMKETNTKIYLIFSFAREKIEEIHNNASNHEHFQVIIFPLEKEYIGNLTVLRNSVKSHKFTKISLHYFWDELEY